MVRRAVAPSAPCHDAFGNASGGIRIRSASLRRAVTSGSAVALARARSPRFARVLFERACRARVLALARCLRASSSLFVRRIACLRDLRRLV
eukprot:6829043-Pyramimonas_sp.AAC.1